MRIGLFTDTYYPETNGVATSVYQLKKELERLGNEVYVFTVSNPIADEKEPNVFRIKSLPFLLFRERRVACGIPLYWYTVIKKLHLDIIHTQTEFGVGNIGRMAAKLFHIPLIHTYHTIYEDYTHYLRIPGNRRLKGLIRRLSSMWCNQTDCVIAPTEKVKKLLEEYGVSKEIALQPTGISLEKFARPDGNEIKRIQAELHLEKEDHILISIGRVSKEKNLEELVRFLKQAAETDRHIKLLIVGDGPQQKELKQLVAAKNLDDHVLFAGEVAWRDIQNYYAVGDVFVSASTSETQGLTYLEALASGKPLLVRMDDCLEDVLLPGKNGVAYQSEAEFLNACENFWNGSKTWNADVIRKSAVKLSSEQFGRHILTVYETVTAQTDHTGRKTYEDYGKIHSMVG